MYTGTKSFDGKNKTFGKLRTVNEVQNPLRAPALEIYQQIFPNCHVKILRNNGNIESALDKDFGIDALLVLADKSWFTLQEKYRDYEACKQYMDFTQEILNGDGSLGEWYKLSAQLYFYGWGIPQEKRFVKWLLLDVAKYKFIVHANGGIHNMGEPADNKKNGRARFVGISLDKIKDAILVSQL